MKQMSTLSELKSAIIDKVRITGIDMSESDISNAELSSLRADKLNLKFAKMSGVKLQAAHLGHCQLNGAKFEGADFSNAVLRMCQLDGGQGEKACFNNARVEDCTAKGANLKAIEIRGAKLSETAFERAVLQGAVFDNSEGEGIEFRGADLSGASLIGVKFNDADFRGADLRGANLSKGQFQFSDFRGALLDGALVEGADFGGAIFDADTVPNMAKAEKEKRGTKEGAFNLLDTMLNDGLPDLPKIFAENKEFIKEITEKVQQTGNSVKQSPDEWNSWAEALLSKLKAEDTINIEDLAETLFKGPIDFQNQSMLGGVSKDELQSSLRSLTKALNTATSEPPEEMKPFLEALMKEANGTAKIDYKAMLNLLSKWSQNEPKV